MCLVEITENYINPKSIFLIFKEYFESMLSAAVNYFSIKYPLATQKKRVFRQFV